MVKYHEMTLQELEGIHEQVAAALTEKREARRAELMAELEKLGGVPAKPPRIRGVTDGPKDGRASPKVSHRGPAGEEWTGRGQPPKWGEKYGAKTREDFEQFRI